MLQQELELTEQILGRFGKLNDAITDGVASLQPLILDRLAAERQLAQAQIAEAVEDGGEEAVEQAKQALQDAHRVLDDAGQRLSNLRGARAGLGGALASAHGALAAQLPGYLATLGAGFRQEWDEAAGRFAPTLARRLALENLLGRKLQLQEPTAGAELPSLALGPEGRPAQVLDSLKEHMSELRAISEIRAYTPTLPAGWPPRPFDVSAVYRVTKAYGAFSVGDLIVAASVEQGRLRWLLETEYVAPHEAQDDSAERALKAIAKSEAAEAERRRADQQAALAARPPHRPKSLEFHALPEHDDVPVPEFVDARTGKRAYPGSGGVQ
jgi:hypothetical protein